MAARHFSRSRPSGRTPGDPQKHSIPVAPVQKDAKPALRKRAYPAAGIPAKAKRKAAAAGPLDPADIVGRFSEALPLVETPWAVLDEVQQDWSGVVARRSCPAVHTLTQGIKAPARGYSELGSAFMALS
jgi:hypothetical protein